MKNLHLIAVILFVIQVISFKGSYSQTVDTGRCVPDTVIRDCYHSYQDLQKFFLSGEKNQFKDLKQPHYLYSIKYDTINMPDPSPKYFRLGYDYLWTYNTHNISLGINPLKYREEGINLFLSGRVGFGGAESKLIFKDVDTYAKINSMFGIEVEVESMDLFKNFKAFAGMGFSSLTPEPYQGDDNTGFVLDPFLGARYYLTPKNLEIKFGLHAKAGFIFTNSIGMIDEDALPIYYGIGANIIPAVSFSKAGKVRLMNLESGLFISPVSGVLYGQFTQPVRLLRNLSVGVNGHIGTGVYEAFNNDRRVNTYWGLGLDIRFFGYDYGQLMKPYLGFMAQNYGYQFDDTTHLSNFMYMLRIGTKIQLGRKSDWCLDINAGAPMGNKEPFIDKEYTLNKAPLEFDVNVGVVYKLRLIEEKKAENYCGEVAFYDESYLKDTNFVKKVGKETLDPMPIDAYADTLRETKIYIVKNEIIPPKPLAKVDVSDIKFFRLFRMVQSDMVISPMDGIFETIESSSNDSLMLFIAMFNKSRCNTSSIDSNNMYLVFNDLSHSRYFGFNYDENTLLQPEQESRGALDVTATPPYYGHYRDYIQKLHWLDSDVELLNMNYIIPSSIEREVFYYCKAYNDRITKECEKKQIPPYLITKDNYRFAYAVYPKKIFMNVKHACRDFGVSIMFRYDLDKNSVQEHMLAGLIESPLQGLVLDTNDAAYFSNIVHASDIFSPCRGNDITIDNFTLGKDNLTEKHRKILSIQLVQNECSISSIMGFTDQVEFQDRNEYMSQLKQYQNHQVVKEIPSLKSTLEEIIHEWDSVNASGNVIMKDSVCQRFLAWRRILAACEEIKNIYDVGKVRNMKAIPVGIDPDAMGNDPKSRKVIIQFAN